MKTFKLIVYWPAVILTSIFTPFMYHATDHNGEQVIVLSRKWTIINSIFSTVVSSGGTVVIFILIIGIGNDGWKWFILSFFLAITLSCMLITLFLILGLFYGPSPKLQRSGICVNDYDKTVDVDKVVDDVVNDEEMKALN